MESSVSRQGRRLQRYSKRGYRLVVGCIPYKFNVNKLDGDCGGIDKSLEVLVISSQKGHDILFPKGGWESDETMEEAVLREASEEAGVHGNIEVPLGKWRYNSRSHNAVYEGTMFPLNVTEELCLWPEKDLRQRKWVTVSDGREGCPHLWMREALDELVSRLSSCGKHQSG